MAMPAIIGLSSSSVHSSFVKLDLSATIAFLKGFQHVPRRIRRRSVFAVFQAVARQ
jgi:hypothetical protein